MLDRVPWTESESYVMTDGQPASVSWNKAPIWGLQPDLYYYCLTVAGLLILGALWQEDGPIVYNSCWSSPAQSFSGSSPMGLVAIFYCLRFETSLFVASYDSQGHGGGIRPRLHKGDGHTKVKVMLRPTVSRPDWLGTQHPFVAYDHLMIIDWQLRVCWFGAPSLMRGRVCRLQLLLALASTVIFGSESHRTRGHILLSQIRDFPFHHPLRLAGSRWRYSTPTPHGLRGLSLSLMLRPMVRRPVCLGTKHPSGAYDQILIIVWQLRVCWFGAPSLMRGRVCRLQLLLDIASTVIFGSESCRTRGHILLSQIRDFPFRRLLRLAGSRWRYSTPPPHGCKENIG
jgi:hypothetical protein